MKLNIYLQRFTCRKKVTVVRNFSTIKSSKIGKIFTVKAKTRSLVTMSDDKKDKKGEENAWKDAGWFVLKTAVISGAVLGGTAVALPAIGFTAGGVAAGSLAAGFQSTFLGGTIASGSAFAMMQSVGAAGLAASTQAAVVGVSAAAAGAHSALKRFKKKVTDPDTTAEEPSKSNKEEDGDGDDSETDDRYKTDDNEVQVEAKKINDVPGLDVSGTKNNGTGKEKKYPVKFVKSYRKDDSANDSLGLNCETRKSQYQDEMDSLRAKWEDVELSSDLTVTQQLVKKGKMK